MKKKILWTILMLSVVFVFASGIASAKTYGGEFDSATKDANGNFYT